MEDLDVKQPRQQRADKGAIRDTAFDIQLLRFIAEHKSVDLEIIQWLRVCGPDAAKDWVERRMQPKDYLRTIEHSSYEGERTFVWVSATGMQRAGLQYKAERPGQLQHAHAVAVVHLFMQGVSNALQQPEQWLSERQIRRRIALDGNKHEGVHVPDGVFQEHIAIECERNGKRVEETAEIINSLLLHYQQVIYVVSRAAESKVRRAIEMLSGQQIDAAMRANVLLLEDVEAEVRKRYMASLRVRSGTISKCATHSITNGVNHKVKCVPAQEQRLKGRKDLFAVLENTISHLFEAKKYQHAFSLIDAMVSLSEIDVVMRWKLMILRIIVIGCTQSASAAEEMFRFLLDDMRLSEALHTTLKAIGAARLLYFKEMRPLVDENLILPKMKGQITVNELQAALEFYELLDWCECQWNILTNIGVTYEAEGYLQEAQRAYSRVLLLGSENVSATKQASLLIALARVCCETNQHNIGRAYYEAAAAKLEANPTSSLYQRVLKHIMKICQWQQDGPAALVYHQKLDAAMRAMLNP